MLTQGWGIKNLGKHSESSQRLTHLAKLPRTIILQLPPPPPHQNIVDNPGRVSTGHCVTFYHVIHTGTHTVLQLQHIQHSPRSEDYQGFTLMHITVACTQKYYGGLSCVGFETELFYWLPVRFRGYMVFLPFYKLYPSTSLIIWLLFLNIPFGFEYGMVVSHTSESICLMDGQMQAWDGQTSDQIPWTEYFLSHFFCWWWL